MIPLWLAVADGAPGVDLTGLGQYGAVGIMLLAFLVWAFRVWARLEARCDRLEAQLAEQNKWITERMIGALTQATLETAKLVEDQRRRR